VASNIVDLGHGHCCGSAVLRFCGSAVLGIPSVTVSVADAMEAGLMVTAVDGSALDFRSRHV
jgi:hypothetical protein